MRRSLFAAFFFMIGWCLMACGGVADESADDENVGEAPSAVSADTVRFIVYLQPGLDNPLNRAVQGFLTAHSANNKASFYPPHISVTGFFETTMTSGEVLGAVASALKNKTPLGQPKLTKVSCNNGLEEIKLLVSVPHSYKNISHDIVNALGLTGQKGVDPDLQKNVDKYHLTLFQAKTTSSKNTTFAPLCTLAKGLFSKGELDAFNRNVFPNNQWMISVYKLVGNVGTGDLTRVGNPIVVNP